MKLLIKDIALWDSTDFREYIQELLETQGIAYTITTTEDFIVINQLLKSARQNGKSKAYVKAKLAHIFSETTFKRITSLMFLRQFFVISIQRSRNRTYIKVQKEISASMQGKLNSLKKECSVV